MKFFDKSLNKTLFPRHFSICEEIRNKAYPHDNIRHSREVQKF